MKTKTGWRSRGDQYHWDHADGSFIELEGCALSPSSTDRYILYSPECARLGSLRSLERAYQKHAELERVA